MRKPWPSQGLRFLKGVTVLKMLISLAVGIAIGAGVAFALMPENNNVQHAVGLSAACPLENPQDKNSLQRLQQENMALLVALKNAEAVRSSNAVSSLASGQNANVTPDCTADVNRAISAFQESDKIVSELRNAKSLQDYDTNLHNQFISKEPNEALTKDVENRFYDAVDGHPDRQSLVISSLECRSRTCKVKIPATDDAAKNHFMELMSDPSFSKALGFEGSTIRSAMEITGGEMTLYISNNQ